MLAILNALHFHMNFRTSFIYLEKSLLLLFSQISLDIKIYYGWGTFKMAEE